MEEAKNNSQHKNLRRRKNEPVEETKHDGEQNNMKSHLIDLLSSHWLQSIVILEKEH